MNSAPVYSRQLLDSPLFAALSELEFNAVCAFLERQKVAKGSVVFREGENGQELFIVLSGKVNAVVTQSDGTRRKVYEFGPGSFFGEMAVIEAAPRSATCTALEDCELMVLQGLDFYRLVFEHPMIALKLLGAIGSVMTSWLDESSSFLNDLVRWGEKARRRAVSDELSGLYNRRFLEESLSIRLSRCKSGGRDLVLVMADLDRIHSINEQFGTDAGDRVIASSGSVLASVLREGDIAARLAGDEFAFLLPDTSLDEAFAIAERQRKTLERHEIQYSDEKSGKASTLRIKASIGLAAAPVHALSVSDLFCVSDYALKCAKESGRNRVHIYTPVDMISV